MSIAFDNVIANTSSTTFSFTTSGSDRALLILVERNTAGGDVSATYNGINLTSIGHIADGGSGLTSLQGLLLINPTIGTNTLVLSGGGTVLSSTVVSYTGVSGLDVTASSNGNSPTGSVNLTTVTDNCWVIAGFLGAFVTSSANVINRGTSTTPLVGDTANSITPTGSVTQTASTAGGNTSWAAFQVALFPSTTTATSPQFNNSATFASSGTNNFSVSPSTPNNVLIVWGEAVVSGSAYIPPTITYGGVAVTFPYPSANISTPGLVVSAPYVGYIVNPTPGTNSLVSNVPCSASVFYAVDQSNPLPTENTSAGTSTSPRSVSITTASNNSLVLKSFNTTSALSYSDGSGEINIFTLTSGEVRGSYKQTTTSGTYSVSTSWTGGSSIPTAIQALELKFVSSPVSGLIVDSISSTGGTGSSFSFNHSIGNGLNRVAILTIQAAAGVLSNATGVTFNGVTMTQIIRRSFGGGGTGFVYEYLIVNPSVGLGTISVTMASSGDFAAGCVSFFGAKTSSPIGATNSLSNNSFFGSSVSVPITTTRTGSIIVDSMMAGVSSPTPGASQVQINNSGISEFPLQFSGASSYLKASTISPYSMIWNGTFGGGYAQTAVEVIALNSNGPANGGAFLINFL